MNNRKPTLRLDNVATALSDISKSVSQEQSEFRNSTPLRLSKTFNQTENENCLSDKILRKVAFKLPSAATQKNWTLSLSDDYSTTKAEKLQGDYRNYHKALDTKRKLRKALQYARAYGGSCLILKINDGGRYDEPVRLEKIKSIDSITVRHRFQIEPDISSGYIVDLDDVEFYRLVNIDRPLQDQIETMRIHRDRIIRIEGEHHSDEWMIKHNRGWGQSVFDITWQYFKMYKNALLACGELIRTHSMLQQSIEGLRQMMVNSSDKGVDAIKQAAKVMRLMYDLYGMVLVDSKEQVNWQARPVTGINELVNLIKEAFQAASETPHTILWGESENGTLGDGGRGTRQNWAETVEEYQSEVIDPILEILDNYIFIAKDGPTKGKQIEDAEREYPTIMRYSAEDMRQARSSDAQTLTTLLSSQALLAEEVRTVLSSPDWWPELSLDDKKFEEQAQQQGGYGAGGYDAAGYDYNSLLSGESKPKEDPNTTDNPQPEQKTDSIDISLGDESLWKGDITRYRKDYFSKYSTYRGCFK